MSKRSCSAAPSAPQGSPKPKFPRVQQYANDPGAYAAYAAWKNNTFSLVELVFSKNKQCPDDLEYQPTAGLKNSCFVLRVDFGAVNADREGAANWEEVGRRFDKNVRDKVEQAVHGFLDENTHVKSSYSRSASVATNSGDTLEKLAWAVKSIDPDAHFFVLVDEYDQPMHGIPGMETLLKNAYPEYTGFFKACNTISSILHKSKTWLTGITPLALPLLSGFSPDVLAFHPDLADVVGLCDEDVDRMLDQVHTYNSFKDDDEKARVRAAIKEHYNGLMFLSGSGLYHTRLMNYVMADLLIDFYRRQWL
eukprot:scaffold152182_cov43-Attheya_sp.AAC.2